MPAITPRTGTVLLGGYPHGGGPRDPSLNVCTITPRTGSSAFTLSNANVTVDGFTVTVLTSDVVAVESVGATAAAGAAR